MSAGPWLSEPVRDPLLPVMACLRDKYGTLDDTQEDRVTRKHEGVFWASGGWTFRQEGAWIIPEATGPAPVLGERLTRLLGEKLIERADAIAAEYGTREPMEASE